jgi:beta-aspartyl-peptidase (threonine type)
MPIPPVIIGTRNSADGLKVGMEVLRKGGSAIDAVEEAIKVVEQDEDDWSVGLGGTPNLLGVTELDASIMIGSTQQCGAVAGIRRHCNPISIARKVLELTPHVMLIGEGADDFADIVGITEKSPTTPRAKRLYEDLIHGKRIDFSDEDPERVRQMARSYNERLPDYIRDHKLLEWYQKWTAIHKGGTVNVIALDSGGEIVSGVSTSGLALKLPGRVGDSPIIGAGNYATRSGAAACTGHGEGAIRLSLAFRVVRLMDSELPLSENLDQAILEFCQLMGKNSMHIIAMDRTGRSAASGTTSDLYYCRMTEGDSEPQRIPSSCPLGSNEDLAT